MTEEIKKHIEKLRKDKSPTYQQDAEDMKNILLNLDLKNYEMAESIYSKMDTIVRDDFVEKMTNGYKDKEKMKYLADKLGFEWIGDQKKFLKIKELGKCPHCDSEDYSQYYSEMITNGDQTYCIFDCTCNNCGKDFTEYFSQDETKFEDEDGDEVYLSNFINNSDKTTLIKALNLLVQVEGDINDYSLIFEKLKDELIPRG